MKIEDVIIGKVYQIVGSKGGCDSTDKCIDCEFFPENLIKVESKNEEKIHAVRMINGKVEGDDKCDFLPEDLELVKIKNWRDKICQNQN